MYVPEIGDLIKLTEDWNFNLNSESYRNRSLAEILGKNGPVNNVTLPKDTVLKIDRIYIRKGASDYSSLTFRIEETENKKIKGKRFWAKLRDVNKIEFDENRDVVKYLSWNKKWRTTSQFLKSDIFRRNESPRVGTILKRIIWNRPQYQTGLKASLLEQYTGNYEKNLEYKIITSHNIEVLNSVKSGNISNSIQIKLISKSFKLYDANDNLIHEAGSIATLKKFAHNHFNVELKIKKFLKN